MNIEDVGLSFAVILKNNKDDSKKSKKISTTLSCEDNKSKVRNYFEEFHTVGDETLQLIPSKERERSVLYVVGSSGSGKSYFSCNYIKQYHRIYPKRQVYVFSIFEKDKSLDSLKFLRRIKLNDEFMNTSLELKDFANSLLLFDDCDAIKDKLLRLRLKKILNSCLELGRHENVEIIYISHLCCKSQETSSILNESTSVTFFPKTFPARSCKYLLDQYYGLDNVQIKRIKNLKSSSRAVTILRTYPNIVLSDKQCYILKDDD
tara:strand:+ start:1582 stop:2367 length:786 start_codon:yes stop_codon:yes gene_type:complete